MFEKVFRISGPALSAAILSGALAAILIEVDYPIFWSAFVVAGLATLVARSVKGEVRAGSADAPSAPKRLVDGLRVLLGGSVLLVASMFALSASFSEGDTRSRTVVVSLALVPSTLALLVLRAPRTAFVAASLALLAFVAWTRMS